LLGLVVGCAASSKPLAADAPAARDALEQLSPPDGFAATGCVGLPGACFVSHSLVEPATVRHVAEVVRSFGATVDPTTILCDLGVQPAPAPSVVSCQAYATVGHVGLAVTVTGHRPRGRTPTGERTVVAFTAVRTEP
jgi:hypothetical protein